MKYFNSCIPCTGNVEKLGTIRIFPGLLLKGITFIKEFIDEFSNRLASTYPLDMNDWMNLLHSHMNDNETFFVHNRSTFMLMKKDRCRSFLHKIEMELINPDLKPIQPSHNERNTESSDNDEDSEDDDIVTKHSDYHRTTPYQVQDDDEDNEEEEDSAEVKEETNKYGYSHESDSESSSSSNLFEVSDEMDTNESEANSDEYGSGVNDEDNPSFATKKRVMDDESSSDQSTDGKTKDKLSVQVNRSEGPVATPNNVDSSVGVNSHSY